MAGGPGALRGGLPRDLGRRVSGFGLFASLSWKSPARWKWAPRFRLGAALRWRCGRAAGRASQLSRRARGGDRSPAIADPPCSEAKRPHVEPCQSDGLSRADASPAAVARRLTAVLFAIGLYLGFSAPPDYQQGETVKIMYIHVPAAWLSTFIYGVMALASLGTLVWRHPLADAAQKAAAPLGAGFTFICLVTGSLWGKPMWGTYWVWDARLTSVLVLFIIYLGLIALWRSIDDPGRAALAAAILTLVGAVICRSSNSRSIGGIRCISPPRCSGWADRPSRRNCCGRCWSWRSRSRCCSSRCI